MLRYKKGLSLCVEAAKKVSKRYGMDWGIVLISELWCRIRYGANLADYQRFEFYKKNHHERNRYLTIRRWENMLKPFGTPYGDLLKRELT